jgi:hypothetical protein
MTSNPKIKKTFKRDGDEENFTLTKRNVKKTTELEVTDGLHNLLEEKD